MSNGELLKIRNFGEKSLDELLTKLKEEQMLSEQEWASRMASQKGDIEDEDGGDGAKVVSNEDIAAILGGESFVQDVDEDSEEDDQLDSSDGLTVAPKDDEDARPQPRRRRSHVTVEEDEED
jgi:hypothetical protein